MGHRAGTGTGRGRRARGGVALGAVLVVAAFVLAACGSSDADDDTTTTKASGSKDATTTTAAADDGLAGAYAATNVTGYEPVAGSQLTVTFEDGQMAVNAGCNILGGAYSFTDGTLKWDGPARATQMACTDELMAQDTWLTELFTTGVEAEVDGATLTLTSDDVTITLEAVADAPLKGTTWTLTGTVENEGVSSLPAGAKAPTLTIGDEGTAQIFTGCNTGSTTVDIGDGTMTFAPMVMTRMACEPVQTTLEHQVTAVLDGEVTFTLDGDTLTITNGDQGLVYTAT